MESLVFGCVSAAFVLIVGDVFEPFDSLAIELLLQGNVRHRVCRRRPMPMLFARRKPDNVTRPDLFDRSAPALRASGTGSDDQRLPERMGMPRGARAGLERHGGADNASGSRSLKQRIYPDGAGEPFGRTLSGRLRTYSLDLHETPQLLRDQTFRRGRSCCRADPRHDRRVSAKTALLYAFGTRPFGVIVS